MNQSLLYQRELYKKVRKNSRRPTPTVPMDRIILPPNNLKQAFTPPRFRKPSKSIKKKLSESTEIFGRNPNTMPPMTEVYGVNIKDNPREPDLSTSGFSIIRKSSRSNKKRSSTAPIQRPSEDNMVSYRNPRDLSNRNSENRDDGVQNEIRKHLSNRKFPKNICIFLKKLRIFDPVPLKIHDWRNGLHLSTLVSRLEMANLKGIHKNPTKKPQILHNLNQALAILRKKKGFKSNHLFETIEIQEGNEKSIIGIMMDIFKHYKNHYLTLRPKKKKKGNNNNSSSRHSSVPPTRKNVSTTNNNNNVNPSSVVITNPRIRKTEEFVQWLQKLGFKNSNPRVFHNPSSNVLRDPLRNGTLLRQLLEFLEPPHFLPNFFWKKNTIPRVVTGAENRVAASLAFLQKKSHKFNSISARQIVDGSRSVYFTIQKIYYKTTIKKKKTSKKKQKKRIKKTNTKKKNVDLRSRSYLLEFEEEKKFNERRSNIVQMKKQLAVERKLLIWMDRIGVLDNGQFLLSPKKNKNNSTLLARNYRRMRDGLTPRKKKRKKSNSKRSSSLGFKKQHGGIDRLKDLDDALRDGRILCRIATIFKRRIEGIQAPEIYCQNARGLEHISLANINRAFAFFRGTSCRGLKRRYLFKDRAIFKGVRKITIGLLFDLAKFDREQRQNLKGNEFETYMFGDQKEEIKADDIFFDYDNKEKNKNNKLITPIKKKKKKNKKKSRSEVNLSKLIELSVFEDEDDLNRSLGNVEEISRRMKLFDENGIEEERRKSRFIGLETWLLRLKVVRHTKKKPFLLDRDPLDIFSDGVLLYKLVKILEKRRGNSIESMMKGGKIDPKPKKRANCLFNIRKVLNVLKENRDMDLSNLWSEEEIYEGNQSTIIQLLKDIKKAYRNSKKKR